MCTALARTAQAVVATARDIYVACSAYLWGLFIAYMSLVDIRVDLPTHSHSFTVSVPSRYSVLQVKQEIYGICPGQPRPEGQRLIWRGRLLSNDEKVESLWKVGSYSLLI